eukprot:3720353-Amphidinium_carterae.1
MLQVGKPIGSCWLHSAHSHMRVAFGGLAVLPRDCDIRLQTLANGGTSLPFSKERLSLRQGSRRHVLLDHTTQAFKQTPSNKNFLSNTTFQDALKQTQMFQFRSGLEIVDERRRSHMRLIVNSCCCRTIQWETRCDMRPRMS